jgi:anti-anti-sigma regulatory factor
VESGDGFSVVVERNGHGAVIKVAGVLDERGARSVLDTVKECDGRVVVDLSRTSAVETGAANALVDTAWRRMSDRGSDLVFRGASPAAMDLLAFEGVEPLVRRFSDRWRGARPGIRR